MPRQTMVTVRADDDVIALLDEVAAFYGVSVSETVRRYLREGLARDIKANQILEPNTVESRVRH